MWTKPLDAGGVVGGNDYAVPGVGWFEGSAYEERFSNPIIINGYLYYTEPISFMDPSSGPTDCVNLATGQLVWSRYDVPALSFGYIYNVYDPNQHGVYPAILFTSNFARAFDAQTGDPLFNVTGVPSGTTALGPQGEWLKYVITNTGTTANPAYYLAQWNSSKMFVYTDPPSLYPAYYNMTPVTNPASTNNSYTLQSSAPLSANANLEIANGGININSETNWDIINANIPINSTTYGNEVNGTGVMPTYDWNISIPWLNTMGGATIGSSSGANPVTVLAAFPGNMLLCRNATYPTGFGGINQGTSQHAYTYFSVSLAPTTLGNITWMQTYQPPPGNVTVSFGGVDPTAWNGVGYGVYVEGYEETMQWVGYSMSTGTQLWGPTPSQTAFDYYGNPIYPYVASQLAYGNLYSSAFGGITYCYNLTTGALEWTYGNGGAGNTTKTNLVAYGDYPTFIQAVGNGIIYLATTEHTITDPIYKGALARAINATTGQEIWTLSDYTG